MNNLVYKNFSKNKMTKMLILTMIMLLVVLSFSACNGQSDGEVQGETRVITDSIGRQVTIPKEVDRIGCLYAFAGHVTGLLGQEEKIVSVVAGLKRDILFTEIFPNILELPVPFNEGAINIEELVKSKPDVVFIRRSTVENKGEMDKLSSFGIPAVVVDSNTIEEQREAVRVVGEVCGGVAIEKAQAYDKMYEDALKFAQEKASQIPESERVRVYHSINEAVRTDVKGTIGAQWTEAVGVLNVSADKDLSIIDGKNYAGLEQIYLWNPDIIICNEEGVPDYMLSDSKWASLSAVRNSKVYMMPVGISRWGHPGSVETPLAIYWLGKLVYPELYNEVNLEAKTKEFYKTFFEIDLSDKEVTGILSGQGMRRLKETN